MRALFYGSCLLGSKGIGAEYDLSERGWIVWPLPQQGKKSFPSFLTLGFPFSGFLSVYSLLSLLQSLASGLDQKSQP